jgi:hypothetical protein
LKAITPGAGALSQGAISEALRKAVLEEQSRLTELDPAQKRVFQEEVLAFPARFVRDYRASGGKVRAEVDGQAIRFFLAPRLPSSRPSAVPGAGPNEGQVSIGVVYRAEAGCAKCAQLFSRVRSGGGAPSAAVPLGFPLLVTDSLRRRGFVPVVLSGVDFFSSGEAPSFSPGRTPEGASQRSAWERRLGELAAARGWGGVGLFEASRVPVDPDDPEQASHADDPEYLLASRLVLAAPGEAVDRKDAGKDAKRGFDSGTVLTHAEELRFLGSDSPEPLFQQLFVDAWTGIGGRWLARAASVAGDAGTVADHADRGVALRLRGFRDFAGYSALRAQLRAALSEMGTLEERRLAQGQVVFVLRPLAGGALAAAVVRSRLSAASSESASGPGAAGGASVWKIRWLEREVAGFDESFESGFSDASTLTGEVVAR